MGLLERPFPQAASLALDIETDPTRGQALVVLSLSDGRDSILIDLRDRDAHEYAEWLVRDVYDREIVGHNLAFDLMHLHDNFGCGYPALLYDTMLAEQCLSAGLPAFDNVGLDDVLGRYCGVYLDKSLQTSFRVDEELTTDQIEYALGDVIHLHTIQKIQRETLRKNGLTNTLTIELGALQAFAEMTRVGVWIDMERMGPLLERNRQTRDRLKRHLQLMLTPIIMNERQEKRAAQEVARAEWRQLFDEATAQFEHNWTLITEDWFNEGRATFDDEWFDKKWVDGTIDKKDGKPKGMKRYVREMMSTRHWRSENPIPKLEPIDMELINLNSSKQMLYVFNKLGLEPVDLDGKETTGKKTLEALLADATEEQRDVLIPYLQYRKAEKIETSFGDRLLEKRDAVGRVHGSYKQYGTATGRPAAMSPNMNQMPNQPEFRGCFRAESGDLFVVADYQQMELRIIAQLSGDEAMQTAFREGRDLHTYTAALMFNTPESEVTEKQRKTAKTINFGILYGMGPKKLRGTLAADGIDMTYDEARGAIARWKTAYHRAAAQIETWGAEVLSQGYTQTPFGRKRFFNLDFRDENGRTDKGKVYAAQRAGANHPIQGTNADITKLAMAGLLRYLGQDGEIILQVYDEIVVQCRQEKAERVRDLVVAMMETAARMVLTDIPVGVDAVISRSWNEKDAIH